MNFDKLFSGVSTVSGAMGLAVTLAIALALIWAMKKNGFAGPDKSLIGAISDMATAIKDNTVAVKESGEHVQDQLKQFEDSNELIADMVDPLKNISKHTETLAGDVHDEIIRRGVQQ